VEVVHQPAFLDGQYLVEGTGDMEADGGHVLQALALLIGERRNLLFCQIPLVCTAIVEFVTVGLCLDGAEDGAEFW